MGDVIRGAREREERAEGVGPAPPRAAGERRRGGRLGHRIGQERERDGEPDVDRELDQEVVEPRLRRVELEDRPGR